MNPTRTPSTSVIVSGPGSSCPTAIPDLEAARRFPLVTTGFGGCPTEGYPRAVTDDRPVQIRAGTLLDVVAGEARRAQLITIAGNRIRAVEPDVGRYAPDARVIDLSGSTVLPGLIDCHSHLIGEVDSGHGTRASCSARARRRR